MKVVYLAATARPGGAERSLLDFLAGLTSARPDWRLRIIFGAHGPLVAEARAVGVESAVLPFPAPLAGLGDEGLSGNGKRLRGRLTLLPNLLFASPSTTAYLVRLRRALRDFAPDLVHTNALKMHILAAWAKPSASKLLWHVHDYVGSRPIMSSLIRVHSRACAAAVANSHSVAEQLRALCGGKLPVYPIYNAVDLCRFSPDGPKLDLDALSNLAPAAAGTVRVGLVGTLARWKGHEVFLNALSMIPANIRLRGYVVGGPIYQTHRSQHSVQELRKLAGRLGLGERVGFTGFIDDVAAAMRSVDIVVHASVRPEPFGLVIAEAMACGRALVINNAGGGASEIVLPGKEALSCRPGDASALAKCVLQFARDKDLRSIFGARARASAEMRFDRRRLARELLDVYAAVA